jgi:hypothetical protein
VGQPAIPNHAGRLSCTGTVGSYLPFFGLPHPMFSCIRTSISSPDLFFQVIPYSSAHVVHTASVNLLQQYGWAKFDCFPYILLNTSPEPLCNSRVISDYLDNVLCIELDAQSRGGASGAIMLPLAIAHVVGQELYVSQTSLLASQRRCSRLFKGGMHQQNMAGPSVLRPVYYT